MSLRKKQKEKKMENFPDWETFGKVAAIIIVGRIILNLTFGKKIRNLKDE
tara:strand:- start:78 stop:227 length:150 start_codon:yes stop_codon:yes gene_type:complete